jgi:hypothetical protein
MFHIGAGRQESKMTSISSQAAVGTKRQISAG